MRAAVLALLLFQHLGGECEDELVLRWNAFANAANRYLQTRPAKESDHLKAKKHLEQLWQAVYRCECF